MMEKHILLLRHGETDWNVQMRFQGLTEIPLNASGEKQAATLRPRISEWSPDLVLVSPLGRALRTAELVTGFERKNITVLDDLREICFGEWEGKNLSELRAAYDYYPSWVKEPFSVTVPRAETLQQILDRAERVLDYVRTCNARRILIVSHGGTLRALLSAALEISLRDTWKHFLLSNCSLSGLDFAHDKFILNFYNDRSQPLIVNNGQPIFPPIRF